MPIGYARVSTEEQSHAVQLDALRGAGYEAVGERGDRAARMRASDRSRNRSWAGLTFDKAAAEIR